MIRLLNGPQIESPRLIAGRGIKLLQKGDDLTIEATQQTPNVGSSANQNITSLSVGPGEPFGGPGDVNVQGNLTIRGYASFRGSLRLSTFTQGSVLFSGASGEISQDNANLFWDDTNNWLGIGNAAPTVPLDVTGAVKISSTLAVAGMSTLTGAVGVGTAPTAYVGVRTGGDIPVSGGSLFAMSARFQGNLIAAANSNSLYGVNIAPTVDSASKTGLTYYGLSVGAVILDSNFTTGYGIYAAAPLSATTNYAGYFSGQVAVTGNFTVGSTLVSDAVQSINASKSTGASSHTVYGLYLASAFTTTANGDSINALLVTPTVNVNSKTSLTYYGIRHGAVTLTSGVTNAYGLHITAPTSATNTYAAYLDGRVQLTQDLQFAAASAKIIPGATSLLFRNNADNADNLSITDAGVLQTRSSLGIGIAPTQALMVLGYGDFSGAADSRIDLRATNNTVTTRWYVGAPGGTNGAIIGTVTNHNFYFMTNDTTRMTLNSTGLGIGVSPSSQLHVKGDVQIGLNNAGATNEIYRLRLASQGAATNNNYTAILRASGGLVQPSDSSLVISVTNFNGSSYEEVDVAQFFNNFGTDSTAPHTRLYNGNSSGQIPLEFFINGTVRGRVRADFVGNMNYAANGGDHYWFIGGDSGTGTERMRLRASGGLSLNGTADMGAGTINANAVYDDGVGPLTDYLFDLAYEGKTNPDEKKHPWWKERLWSIAETEDFTRTYRHLPNLPGRSMWLKDKSHSLGQISLGLWETSERQQLHIFELRARLEAAESKLAALGI